MIRVAESLEDRVGGVIQLRLAAVCWEKEYIVYLWFSLVPMLLVVG